MKDTNKLNQFRKAKSKEDFITFDKDLPLAGFTNDFWTATYIEGTNPPVN